MVVIVYVTSDHNTVTVTVSVTEAPSSSVTVS